MTEGNDDESLLPVSNEESNSVRGTSDSSSPTEETPETTALAEEQTASPSPSEDEGGDPETPDSGSRLNNLSVVLSPSIMSDYSKPDPPASVNLEADKEKTPRGGSALDTNDDTQDMDTIPDKNSPEKMRLDFINVPSLSQEEENSEEGLTVNEEENIAQVLTNMRATTQQTETAASTITSLGEEVYPTVQETTEDPILGLRLESKEEPESFSPESEQKIERAETEVYAAPVSNHSPSNHSPPTLRKPDFREGPDDLPVLPRVDMYPPLIPRVTAQPQVFIQHLPEQHQTAFRYAPMPAPVMAGGRRKIRLRLQEDIRSQGRKRTRSFLGHIRRKSTSIMFGSNQTLPEMNSVEFTQTDRGNITVSWFEGTSSLELHEHVKKSIIRKLKLDSKIELTDIRVIDESVDPPEEIILSPYIPDGAHFLLRFSINDSSNDGMVTPGSQYSSHHAPISPSAAPSPHPQSDLAGLNANQLGLLRNQLNALRIPSAQKAAPAAQQYKGEAKLDAMRKEVADGANRDSALLLEKPSENKGTEGDDSSNELSDIDDEDMLLHSDDPVEGKLREIMEMLITDRQSKSRSSARRQEKKQVIFVMANYFVLFLSLIAISVEIQARAPQWASWMETQLKNVQDCAADQDALFKCVSNGDIAGLIASVLLWLSRSVATKRIFLFGFETTGKLWTVVYESFVTSACWGFSYMFIRRGMNPDTRNRFLQKYWKDAVYGSLAGFNAAFMKQVLKNLIPQEAVEDALRDRQLKILSWLPSFHY